MSECHGVFDGAPGCHCGQYYQAYRYLAYITRGLISSTSLLIHPKAFILITSIRNLTLSLPALIYSPKNVTVLQYQTCGSKKWKAMKYWFSKGKTSVKFDFVMYAIFILKIHHMSKLWPLFAINGLIYFH